MKPKSYFIIISLTIILIIFVTYLLIPKEKPKNIYTEPIDTSQNEHVFVDFTKKKKKNVPLIVENDKCLDDEVSRRFKSVEERARKYSCIFDFFKW